MWEEMREEKGDEMKGGWKRESKGGVGRSGRSKCNLSFSWEDTMHSDSSLPFPLLQGCMLFSRPTVWSWVVWVKIILCSLNLLLSFQARFWQILFLLENFPSPTLYWHQAMPLLNNNNNSKNTVTMTANMPKALMYGMPWATHLHLRIYPTSSL